LARNILSIKEGTEDGPVEPSYIETVPKRGYRFIAAVKEDLGEDGSDLVVQSPARTLILKDPNFKNTPIHAQSMSFASGTKREKC
jgi:DNA-binding winged helix-turn-helix (wHTH) protein